MKHIEDCVQAVQNGGVIGFPTETVYGVGADAFNSDAVTKVFKIKQRRLDKPMSVHIADIEQLHDLVAEIPARAQELIDQHWPGPLTIVFKKSDEVPDIVTSGTNTVGIRFPDHQPCRDLIRACGTPIVGTSANISGQPPCTDFETTKNLFPNIPIYNGGSCHLQEASTVVDVSGETLQILRQGTLKIETE